MFEYMEFWREDVNYENENGYNPKGSITLINDLTKENWQIDSINVVPGKRGYGDEPDILYTLKRWQPDTVTTLVPLSASFNLKEMYSAVEGVR